MDFFHVLILAVVQGITEFLPVSSSAHLILIPTLLGWPDQGVVFDVAVHLGTLAAVVVYFWRDMQILFRGQIDYLVLEFDAPDARVLTNLIIATLPLLIFAWFMKGIITEDARTLWVLGCTSIGFGLLLGAADLLPKKYTTKHSLMDMSMKDAFTFGLMQAFAIIPGTSRAGVCVTAGRLIGCSRDLAGRFGTLMALPVILIAGFYSFWHTDPATVNWADDSRVLGIALILSFFTALGGIHILMKLLTRIGYWPFVIYRVALGSFLLYLVM